jgi:hypothetical protein
MKEKKAVYIEAKQTHRGGGVSGPLEPNYDTLIF